MTLPESEEKLPLESLHERLYGTRPPEGAVGATLSAETRERAYGWEDPPAPTPTPPKRTLPLASKLLIGGVVFFVLSGLVAGVLLYLGKQAISSDRVIVTLTPSTAIASGDAVPIAVTVENDNPTDMLNVQVFVDLPTGTRDAADPTLIREQFTESIGTLRPGEEATRSVTVQLFGGQGQSLIIPVRIEYRVPESNALLIARREFSLGISSSPLTISLAGAAENASGQELTLVATVRSNATAALQDIAVTAALPPGFVLSASEPTADAGGFFSLGTLAPGAERRVRITGSLSGEAGEQKVFRFSVGARNPDGTSTLAAAYADGAATIRVTKPTVAVTLQIDRSSEEPAVVAAGEIIPVLVSWENANSTGLTDVRIEITVEGTALDQAGTSGGTGFYRSSDRTVVFSRESSPGLAALSPGQTGTGSFSVRTRSAAALAGVSQPTATLTARVTGVRNGERVELTAPQVRTLRVATAVSLSATLTPQSSEPPVAGIESNYRVTLTARNTLTSVGGARVTTSIPEYVRFSGAPEGSRVTYNESTRMVTWEVGDLLANASAAATFDIAFLPSTAQSGTSPLLVGEQTFAGTDRFAGAVRALAPALYVDLP